MGRRAANGQQGWWLRKWLSSSTPSVAVAGAELGLWNFLATSCQVKGQPQALHKLWPGPDIQNLCAELMKPAEWQPCPDTTQNIRVSGPVTCGRL